MCLLQAWSEIQCTCRAVAEQIAGRSLQNELCQVIQPVLQATTVLSNTFWSTEALLPERTHFVKVLEITYPVMHVTHLSLALVLFGAANHYLHTVSA